MKINKVGVAGLGLMGGGIAQTAAASGYEVIALETEQRFLDKGMAAITKNLEGQAAKGKITPETKDGILARLKGTTDPSLLAGCDIIIEAIIENFDAKKALFGQLDSLCGPQTVFASNTSSLPIIDIASATKRPDRFVGMHFFNPVPVMKLVEIIGTIKSSPETVKTAADFARSLGKTTIDAKDRAGFVVNYLLVPYLFEAIRMLEQGFATKEDIDTGMQLGCSYPMGPLTLSDYIGLDTLCHIGEVFMNEFNEARYSAPPLLKRMVAAGMLGRKSGEGFYVYG